MSVLTSEGFLPCRISGAARRRSELVCRSADIKNAFHQMRIPGCLQAFFSRVRKKNGRSKTPCSRFSDVSCPYDTSNGFFLGDVSCQDVEPSLASDSKLRWLDVCISRMHRKWASRSRFVRVVASWIRRTVGSQSGQGSREAPGPSVHGRMRFASSLRDTRIRPSQTESCANFPGVFLQFRYPSESLALRT